MDCTQGCAFTASLYIASAVRSNSMSIESAFLGYAVDKLRQLADRIEVCLDKLNDDQIWARGAENENAIGNLVLHLCGNMGQWILSTIDDVPDTRVRDAEFEARGGLNAAALSSKLRETVERAIPVISRLNPEQLTRIYRVQNYDASGVEIVFHVVEHFSGHTGQIIFATKMLTGGDLGFYQHLKAAEHTEKLP
jgi:uncharacterized damage-inducible protein DinB